MKYALPWLSIFLKKSCHIKNVPPKNIFTNISCEKKKYIEKYVMHTRISEGFCPLFIKIIKYWQFSCVPENVCTNSWLGKNIKALFPKEQYSFYLCHTVNGNFCTIFFYHFLLLICFRTVFNSWSFIKLYYKVLRRKYSWQQK